MFYALDHDSLYHAEDLRMAMFTDRARQFVGRHDWPLALDEAGLEIDEFDNAATTYCIVEKEGRHQASLRLRPAQAGSMVARHFSQMWQKSGSRLEHGTEVTRFCAAPTLSADERLVAVSDLLLGLCRHCQQAAISSFFGVIFPSVARVIRQCGWAGEVLDEMRDGRGTLLLAEWRASNLVAWDIQECREMRERSWRERRCGALKRMAA